jgi:hypothetical protein
VDRRTQRLFLALIAAQAAHSIEEYAFALYEVFPPARFASSLLSSNLAVGFVILNAAFVVFGLWCYLARVRPGHVSARAWVWPWVLIEAGNGVGHSIIAVARGGYFPGVATAPVLLVLALALGARLLHGHDLGRKAAV